MIRSKYKINLMVPMTGNCRSRRGEFTLQYQEFNTNAIKKLKFLCAAFKRDGLQYDVAYNLDGNNPSMTVTASGVVKRKKDATQRFGMPAILTAEQCRKRSATPDYRLRPSDTPMNVWLADEKAFWREMESLAETRAQFKPGLTDENYYQDEERRAA